MDLVSSSISTTELRSWATAYARNSYGRVSWDVDAVMAYHPKRVLNVGGAPFLFEFLVRRTYPEVDIVSVDIDPERFRPFIDAIGLEAVAANVEIELPRLAGDFDVVVFAELLEHCRINLIETVSRIATLVGPGGRLYLTTPNGTSLARRLRFMRGRSGPSLVNEWSKLTSLGHMGHVREYSAKELRELFEYCGLEVERLTLRPAHHTGKGASHRLLRRFGNTVPAWRDTLVYTLRVGADRTPPAQP